MKDLGPRVRFAAIVAMIATCVVPAAAQFPVAPVQPQQPVQPQPSVPAQNTDPRVAQLKAALDRQGIRTTEVGFTPATASGPGLWYAVTPAAYARPSFNVCIKQAMDVWWVMYNVVGQDPPAKTMIHGQTWNRYEIHVMIKIGTYRDFLATYRAAQSDEQRRNAFEWVYDQATIRVWDLEQRRFADTKDFVTKNFE